MVTYPNTLSLTLPVWVESFCAQYQATDDIQNRMAFVIDAAQKNIDTQSGGPFAAAVFNDQSGELIALGVNLVIRENLAMAHAEMLALALAQRQLNCFSLNHQSTRYQLVTSNEPCAMCLGAVCWSGVSSLVCGASSNDAQSIGFDEGPIHDNWQAELTNRGIKVSTGILKAKAAQVLNNYHRQQGPIYNSSHGQD